MRGCGWRKIRVLEEEKGCERLGLGSEGCERVGLDKRGV